MVVELALGPVGLRHGLLQSTPGDGWLTHVVGSVFGYVLVAFVVAYVAALLVTALSDLRVPVPSSRRVPAASDRILRVADQTFPCFPLLAISPSQPRAPPA